MLLEVVFYVHLNRYVILQFDTEQHKRMEISEKQSYFWNIWKRLRYYLWYLDARFYDI